MSKELAKVIGENGLVYHLAEDGCYYPDLSLEQKTDYSIGKYGMMRTEYMMEHQRQQYLKMLMDGTWNEYLYEVEEECHERIEFIVEQLKVKYGITEELKSVNQMKWVGLMNNVRCAAEDMVVKELIFV